MIFREGMDWPPKDFIRHKVEEHSAWYSGDPNVLSNFYHMELAENLLNLPYTKDRDNFWGRQITNDVQIGLHVPIAGDIASTSADLLFSEPPTIKLLKETKVDLAEQQQAFDKMLELNGFYRRINEAAESASAIGGVYLKLAWDAALSEYPIPVVEQVDSAYPEFRFGFLVNVTFVKIVKGSSDSKDVFRLLEKYSNDGTITYKLMRGTSTNLGFEVSLDTLEETKSISNISTMVKDILCVYIPNMLPNRYDRNSYVGRSDYAGIEGMMDSLDEIYSAWMRDINLGKGRILIPDTFLDFRSGKANFNQDKEVYVKLDVDPTSIKENAIVISQFDIRSDKFRETALNFIERIVSSAGYSPQSFGLNIEGAAESGTALKIRERKSLSTRGKKENYWEMAIKKIAKLMVQIYKTELRGKIDVDVDITTQFSDSLTNDISEISDALQKINAAAAASVETKVRLLHPDWSEEEVQIEVEKIINENGLKPLQPPETFGFGDYETDEEIEEVEESEEVVDE